MNLEELLDTLYLDIKPNSFKSFWFGLSKYQSSYPILKDVTLKQVEVAFNKNRGC